MASVQKGIPKIRIQRDKISEFCKSHHITHLALFGSVLTDRFSEASDVDVLVEFDKAHIPGFFGLIEMENELACIVGRKADLHTPMDLSRYFRDDVLKQAYSLYGQRQFRKFTRCAN
jgi:predicted nucleotidyltransferase